MNSDIPAKTARMIVWATVVAGTLDMLSAFFYSRLEGHGPLAVLIGIASAVWSGARHAVAVGAIVGLLVHFSIMLMMVSFFVLIGQRIAWTRTRPFISGLLYGFSLWAVMYLIVLPLRWPALFPHFTAIEVAEQLFSHIMLVGIPIAWLTQANAGKIH